MKAGSARAIRVMQCGVGVIVALSAVGMSGCAKDSASLPGSQIEATLRAGLAAKAPVIVHCPANVAEKKGKIVDCPAKLGASTPVLVRVTQDDGEGHYHFDVTSQPSLGDSVICAALTAPMHPEIQQFESMTSEALDRKHPQVTLQWAAVGKKLKGQVTDARASGCDLADVELPSHLEVFQ